MFRNTLLLLSLLCQQAYAFLPPGHANIPLRPGRNLHVHGGGLRNLAHSESSIRSRHCSAGSSIVSPCILKSRTSSRQNKHQLRMVMEASDPSIIDMLQSAGASLFANGHGHGKAAEVENHIEMIQLNNPVLKAILGTSGGWGIILSGFLLLIGQAFESAKELAEHKLPKTMRPVTNSVVSELATLGFVGLLIGALHLGGEDSWLSFCSSLFFGNITHANLCLQNSCCFLINTQLVQKCDACLRTMPSRMLAPT
jgi:hypothetical protein